MIWLIVGLVGLVLWLLPIITAFSALHGTRQIRRELNARLVQLEQELARLRSATIAPAPAEPAQTDPTQANLSAAPLIPTDAWPPQVPPPLSTAELSAAPLPELPDVLPDALPTERPADLPHTQASKITQPQQLPSRTEDLPALHVDALAPVAATQPEPSVLPEAPIFKAKPMTNLEPDEQSLPIVTSVWRSLLGWFSGGNLIVRVGVLVLLVGVVLLLRLASHYFQTPIELRLALVAAGGLALTVTGLRLRQRRRGYALSLQGAGLAVLYLTLFAAFRLYAVLPSSLTFGLLAVLAALSAWFALRQDALALALLAFGGGFLAPILTATGQGNVVALFSYYLLLNVALAWIAHQRTWKVLNALSLLMTFGVASFWGWRQFDPALRWPLEALLIAHVGLYLFVAVRYSQLLVVATRMPQNQAHTANVALVDSGLLFGVPLLAMGLQAGLLHDVPFALALSSALLAAVYLLLGRYLLRQGQAMRLMTEGSLALGVGFLALVLPLALDAQWTAQGWAVQGAAMIWLARRQSASGVAPRRWLVVFGLLLQLLSALLLIWVTIDRAAPVLGFGLLAAGAWVSAWQLRCRTDADVALPVLPMLSMLFRLPLLWLALLYSVISAELLLAQSPFASLWARQSSVLHWTIEGLLLAAGLLWVLRRAAWQEAQVSLRLWLPLLGVLLWWHLGRLAVDSAAQTVQHGLLVVAALVLLLLGRQLLILLAQQQLGRLDQALYVLGAMALLAGLPDLFWPNLQPITPVLLPSLVAYYWFSQPQGVAWLNRSRLLNDCALPVLLALLFWLLAVNLSASGGQFGLPYVPLLNLLDLSIAALLLLLWRWRQQFALGMWRKLLTLLLGVAVFLSLNGMLVRTLHQWNNSPLWSEGAWSVDSVQTSLTLLWTLLALAATVLASRQGWRSLWLAGIALLALVVLKLLWVDLSHVAAMWRVVSFMGAGFMMLVIGYVAPLPPPRAAPESTALPFSPMDRNND